MRLDILDHLRNCDNCHKTACNAYTAVDCAICGKHLQDAVDYVGYIPCHEMKRYETEGQGHVVVCMDCYHSKSVNNKEDIDKIISDFHVAIADFKRKLK